MQDDAADNAEGRRQVLQKSHDDHRDPLHAARVQHDRQGHDRPCTHEKNLRAEIHRRETVLSGTKQQDRQQGERRDEHQMHRCADDRIFFDTFHKRGINRKAEHQADRNQRRVSKTAARKQHTGQNQCRSRNKLPRQLLVKHDHPKRADHQRCDIIAQAGRQNVSARDCEQI